VLPIHPAQAETLNPALSGDIGEVITEVSPNDLAYQGTGPEWYFGSGLSALQCIRLALLAANADSPASVLDFGSGWGRVLRVLKAAYPNAALAACDINEDAIGFCAETFGATPILAKPGQIDLEGAFDLIWCGSVFTHLRDWRPFLNRLTEALTPRGVLVFTTGGRGVVGRLRRRDHPYNLSEQDVVGLLEDYERTGFAYVEGEPAGYGRIAVAAPDFTIAQVSKVTGVRIVLYVEEGWNSHQDVTAVCRA